MSNRENWLKLLSEYVEETESPRHFWIWAGLSVLSGALQRKVWLPFGMSKIFPNLYIMIIAPPGTCRKGTPVGFVRDILIEIQIAVSVDSPTKRALTKELAEVAKTSQFYYENKPRPHCSITLVSKELSTFLAHDPKGMIEALTDLYDSHEVWEYKTSEKGKDKLYGVCTNCILASTPSWIAKNLPEEAIGGGFTSRFILVSGREKYKLVPIPPVPDKKLYRTLVDQLSHISMLVGEFTWGPGAETLYTEWYHGIPGKIKKLKDDRLHGYLERIHVMSIKTAMSIHVAYSDSLIIEADDMNKAIGLLEEILATAGQALGAHGRSRIGIDVQKIIGQIHMYGEILFEELLRINYRNTSKEELEAVLDTIHGMKLIEIKVDSQGNRKLHWVGKKDMNFG